ncbi:phenazine biosynthesis PhzC/PhzF protein [Dacryopinax primogenitus]|uniref:Phenazine biosynthesis PhzC/PhzF protein n=1 Tax=Dacryopinax primogenitus (strain DJM 731) TaxID=1858805 RepID=M5FR33_DACPD|nr:phenazine biosynthesis PhzC/PhzF protein [Dacryopinax primogenitus]EJT99510.1 phenazine biosynthesis PhzC/PhzF protein [Dacryopinax primogenitus]
MALQYTIVDSFTSRPFSGSPACVILLPSRNFISTKEMQLLAREFNLPETAFLSTLKSSDTNDEADVRRYALRGFTPLMEFPICGHATLAAAKVLFSTLPRIKTLKFDTLSGELEACLLPFPTQNKGETEREVEISLPSGTLHPPAQEVVDRAKRAIISALGKDVRFLYFGAGEGTSYSAYLVVEISGIQLDGYPVNPAPLTDLADVYTTVILTHPSPSPDYLFHSRVFAPAEGIPEDPVTGSAHALLASYWSIKLGVPMGRARQVSERGGEMGCVWQEGRCRLRGQARVVMKGEVVLPDLDRTPS